MKCTDWIRQYNDINFLSNAVKFTKEGEIIVESVPDKGSDFSVFLRLPEASMEEHADVHTQTAVKTEEADYEDAFRGRRILLAEDNEINAMIAIEILQEMGASVNLAENDSCYEQVSAGHLWRYDSEIRKAGDRFSSNKRL